MSTKGWAITIGAVSLIFLAAKIQKQSAKDGTAGALPATGGEFGSATGAKDYRDPSGFSLQLADGWRVQTFERGAVMLNGPSQGKFVLILPILGRTDDCATLLQRNLSGNWQTFPGPTDLQVEPLDRGAAARFAFQQGQSRGAILCAETSSRSAMMYAIASPAADFAREQSIMVGMLKSFQYGAGGGGQAQGGGQAAAALPRMVKWREPNEGAWVIQIPEGWQPQGGVQRISNMDVRSGVRIWSSDSTSMVLFNDTRLNKCLVPGAQTMQGQLGAGWQYCQYQTGVQVAEWYLGQFLARDLELSDVQVVDRQDRPETGQEADQRLAQMGVRGFQHSYGQIQFRGSRRGAPVEGCLQGLSQMLWSPDRNLMGGNYTMEVKGYVGPQGSSSLLARIGGHIEGTWEPNYQWIVANRQAASGDFQMTMNALRASAEAQQRAFWARMDAADRRANAVGDLLSGTVRLRDEQGNQYQAKAGSNYYFVDEGAERQVSDPNRAVVGGNIYPSPKVDLRPLEVIR